MFSSEKLGEKYLGGDWAMVLLLHDFYELQETLQLLSLGAFSHPIHNALLPVFNTYIFKAFKGILKTITNQDL